MNPRLVLLAAVAALTSAPAFASCGAHGGPSYSVRKVPNASYARPQRTVEVRKPAYSIGKPDAKSEKPAKVAQTTRVAEAAKPVNAPPAPPAPPAAESEPTATKSEPTPVTTALACKEFLPDAGLTVSVPCPE
jgi:hypothetical protein